MNGLHLLFDATKSDPIDRPYDIYFGSAFNCTVVDDCYTVTIPYQSSKREYGRTAISVCDFSLSATGVIANNNIALDWNYPASLFVMCENISKPPGASSQPPILAQIPGNYARVTQGAGQTHIFTAQKLYSEPGPSYRVTNIMTNGENEQFVFWFSISIVGAPITTKLTVAEMLWFQCRINIRTTDFV